jgi:hypothetical protein
MKLVAGHGAEVSGRPGRDAWMPPRFQDGLRDGRAPGTWVRLPGASVPCPVVTLNDTGVRENARTAAVMVGASGLSGQSSCCARLDILRGGRDLIVPLSSITSPGSMRIVVVLPAP